MTFRSRYFAVLVLSALIVSTCAAQSGGDSQLLRDLQVISADSMEGRLSGSTGAARARAYLATRLKEMGAEPYRGRYEHPFAISRRQDGTNVIAQATGSEDAGRVLVITAHYDHLGVRNGQVFNGADDNASGSAVLLALAEHYTRNRPRHSIVFLWPDAEESSGKGAEVFVKEAGRDSIAFNLNLDMVGRNVRNTLFLSGTYFCPMLRDYLEDIEPTSFRVKYGHDRPDHPTEDDWTRDSDQVAFHEKGIPHLYLGVEDHADYHRATDDAEKIDPEYFMQIAAYVQRVTDVIDANLDNIQEATGTKKCPVAVR